MGSSSARTRGQRRREEMEEHVSMDEDVQERRQGKPSKQQEREAGSSSKSTTTKAKKRTISNADEHGAPSKKARAAELKAAAKVDKASKKVLKSNKSESSSGGKVHIDRGPHRPTQSKARKFRAPEEINVDEDRDDSEPRETRPRPRSKAKQEEEIDVEESESDSDDIGAGSRFEEGQASQGEEEDDGKRNNYEIPVWRGKQRSHRVTSEPEETPLSDAHDPVTSLFNNNEDVEIVDRKPAKLRRKGGTKPSGKREMKLEAEQPGWDDDERLSDLDQAPRSRNSSHRTKKSKRNDKHRAPTPEPDSEESDNSNSDANAWDIVYKGSRVPILQQSALLRSIIQTANSGMIRYAMTENFYPLPHELERRCRKELYTAASASEVDGSDKVATLIKKDEKYGNDLIAIVRARFGTLRCDVRDYARNCVPGHYRLRPECAEEVKRLRDDDVFIFAASNHEAGYDESKGYQHEAIIAIVRWFFQDRNAVGTPILPEFCSSMEASSAYQEPEIPAPLLAFAATMVYAELDDWKTGTYVKSPFRADIFATTYQSFIDDLTYLREEQCSRYHRLTSTILDRAIQSSRRAGPSNPRTTKSRFLRGALALPDIEDDG